MLWEYAENAIQLLAVIVALALCLFRFMGTRRRAWLVATAIFMGTLLSSYTWTAYLAIMGESPTSFDPVVYFGWNASYLLLLILVLCTKGPQERRYFHPLMLLPIPLNLWQLSLYLPFGGVVNSVYQVLVNTATAYFALQNICWHMRHRGSGMRPPYVAMAALLSVTAEFGMWTSSCLEAPYSSLYYPFSLLLSASYPLIVWAMSRTYGVVAREGEGASGNRFESIIESAFLILVAASLIGGFFVGQWVKGMLGGDVAAAHESGLFHVLHIVPFVFALCPVSFALTTMFLMLAGQGFAQDDVVPGAGDWAFGRGRMDPEAVDEESKVHRTNLLVPMSAIFFLMVCMVVYSSRSIQEVSVANVHEVGEDKIFAVAAQLDNYLETTKSLVWVTADTVDHMSRTGISTDAMEEYIVEETTHQVDKYDENFTGIYGYVQGTYLDGLRWVPPDDYVPTERDWYQTAVAAGGEVAIVPPYVDAQTGDIVITICRALSNGTDVIALDARLNRIQDSARELTIKDKGYGFIVNEDGLVIAHQDEEQKGANLNDTDEGSVRLEVRADRTGYTGEGEEPSICLRIAVHDTGIGIRPEDQEKLFRKFQRVDMSRNRAIEGTGLGLAITKQLLTLMGGTIEVQSEYGVGSTVYLAIPQRVTSMVPVGSFRTRFEEAMMGAKAYAESFRAPDARILVVDDTKLNLVVVVGLLERTEVQIHTASSGEEAIKLARTYAYDLILMDQRMPKMDGTEAMRRIRQLEHGANRVTPFVCLTADAVSGAREHYLEQGFTDYLSKPVDGASLERMLMRYLPADKVQLHAADTEREEPVAAPTRAGGEYDDLRNAGVDPDVGLGYCQGDEALYRSLLGDYLADALHKAEELERHLSLRDWEGYAILAHSLKSTSKMIGATELAELAASMEQAADARDRQTVEGGHARMRALYEDVAAALRSVLGDAAGSDDDASDDDFEILEFLPE